MRISLFFVCGWVPYHIIYSISTNKWYVTRQIKKIWVSVWNEVWLVVSLNPNSEKIEWFYKSDNFINDIAFGASLFNTYFQFYFAVNFSQGPEIIFKMFKNDKIAPLKNLKFDMKMTDIWDFLMFYWWKYFKITQVCR